MNLALIRFWVCMEPLDLKMEMGHPGQVIDNVDDVTFFNNMDLMSRTLEIWTMITEH